ncbi:hypothetical protein [Sphingomonas profundi]|uniref:hypothetical protein n=1 Tax=Alterirhizorhabdus profundi TaxID=2681549 RepID=UPI0012E91C7A|nr:hypothetical protein [Sphingomonas profundi]
MRLRSSGSGREPDTAADRRLPQGSRTRIGEWLNLMPDVADEVQRRQAQTGHLFGETAVEMGVATNGEVQRAVEEQQGFSVLTPGDSRIDPLVVAAFDPDDPLARSARDLRAVVSGARRADGGNVQSIALLGLEATGDTNLLAANLAVACAQAGYRTLLIDANFANPQQHQLFGLPNRVGLSTMLSTGETSSHAAQDTAIRGLSVVTAGPAVPNVSELLDRQKLAHGVDQVLDDYDLLLIDAARGDEIAFAASFGLDAAVMVVRRDVSESRQLQASVERLRRFGTIVLGVVLVE